MTTAPLFGNQWTPDGWRARPAAQQPDWPDRDALDGALDEIRRLPPLVFAGEARNLTETLADAQDGRAFLLVAGDCAESFDAFSADGIRDKLKIILQMAVALTYAAGVPVVKVIGRVQRRVAHVLAFAREVAPGTRGCGARSLHGEAEGGHERRSYGVNLWR